MSFLAIFGQKMPLFGDGMHGHKSLLAKPHVAQPTNGINLKSHDSTAVSL